MSVQQTLSGVDSLVLFENSQMRSGRGTLIHVTRSGIVFEVYNPYSIVQLSEVLPNLSIIRGERTIYNGRAVVSHILTTGLMIIVSVTLVDPWSDLLGLRSGIDIRGETDRFVKDLMESSKIERDYQITVSNMRNLFGEISRWLDEAEVGIKSTETEESAKDISNDLYDNLYPVIAPKFEDLFSEFECVAGDIQEEKTNIHKSFARRELHPFILCSPFFNRSYIKPLGYAGDYEMVNMMLYESNARTSSIYARFVDSYLIKQVAPEAHRNRIEMLVDRLKNEAERVASEEERIFTVLNVGCGPASEIQRIVKRESISNQISLDLMDFNDETIEYASRKINGAMTSSGNKPIIKFIKKSVDELLEEIHEENNVYEEKYDMVYSAGLFDYFSDQICKRLVSIYYKWTRAGGLVTVTNVHSDNPNKNLMEHLLEWYLVYRNERGMEELAPDGTNYEIETDLTGINVFLDIRKDY